MTLSKVSTPAPALVVTACLMTGCATAPGIVPIGNDDYAIAGSSAAELSSGVRDEVRLIEIANRYCEAHGREATLVSGEATDRRLGAGAKGTPTGVVFRCY